VPRKASAKDIRASFRKLARKYHPDLNPAIIRGRKFKQLQEAYDVLSDSRNGRCTISMAFTATTFRGRPGGARPRRRAGRQLDFGGLICGGSGAAGGGSSFRDLFSQFFSGGPVARDERSMTRRRPGISD